MTDSISGNKKRKRFDEELQERTRQALNEIVADIPEVEGMVVTFVYHDGVGDTAPVGMQIVGPGDPNPTYVARALEQQTKVCKALLEVQAKQILTLKSAILKALELRDNAKRNTAGGSQSSDTAPAKS